jgi:charged multivesicular body protein 7
MPPSKPSILALPPYATTPTSRLQSLYSDISRQKHSNPTLYHATVEWWHRVLEEIVSSGMQEHSGNRNGSKLILTANRGLVDQVRVDGVGKPLGLVAVVVSLSSLSTVLYHVEADWLSHQQE